jgi:hypothetical protein
MHNEDFVNYFARIWEKSPSNFPGYEKKYSDREKRERENLFETYEKKFREKQEEIKTGKSDFQDSFFKSLRIFMNTVFDYSDDQLGIILSDGFIASTKDFYTRTRRFDNEIKPEDIYQACRNVWIMNGIQLMQNRPIELTPAIMGYSLLYPYSDNYLDNPAISHRDKILFNSRFRAKLEGKSAELSNRTEGKIFQLVEMIEKQYFREVYPGVYNSLYSIHEAQTKSLELFSDPFRLTDDEVLNISFWKGGASVLADGFLVSGNLLTEEQRALFGYGIYLQVLDDIQDIKEDSEAGVKTLFSCAGRNGNLDWLVNKAINFGRSVLLELNCFRFTNAVPFYSMMQKSLEAMIIQSVGQNEKSYSAAFCSEMEKYSPIGYSFIRRKKNKNKSLRFSMFQGFLSKAENVVEVSQFNPIR